MHVSYLTVAHTHSYLNVKGVHFNAVTIIFQFLGTITLEQQKT